MLDETNYLIEQSQTLSKEQFIEDETLKRAFVRSVEIIGEAAKNLPDGFKGKHPQIEWRLMAGMRDRLVHGYFGVDHDIVWDVVINRIPGLQKELQRIIRKTEAS